MSTQPYPEGANPGGNTSKTTKDGVPSTSGVVVLTPTTVASSPQTQIFTVCIDGQTYTCSAIPSSSASSSCFVPTSLVKFASQPTAIASASTPSAASVTQGSSTCSAISPSSVVMLKPVSNIANTANTNQMKQQLTEGPKIVPCGTPQPISAVAVKPILTVNNRGPIIEACGTPQPSAGVVVKPVLTVNTTANMTQELTTGPTTEPCGTPQPSSGVVIKSVLGVNNTVSNVSSSAAAGPLMLTQENVPLNIPANLNLAAIRNNLAAHLLNQKPSSYTVLGTKQSKYFSPSPIRIKEEPVAKPKCGPNCGCGKCAPNTSPLTPADPSTSGLNGEQGIAGPNGISLDSHNGNILPPVAIGMCLLCGNPTCGRDGVTCASDDEDETEPEPDGKNEDMPLPPMTSVEVDKLFSKLIEQDKETPMEPAAVINTEMFLHQKQALHWMVTRENSNDLGPFWKDMPYGNWYNEGTRNFTNERPNCIKGGILADDMGLGKTLTVIALIFTNYINGKPMFLKKDISSKKRTASSDTPDESEAPQPKKSCIQISSDEDPKVKIKPENVQKEKVAIKKRREGIMNRKRVKESKKGKDAGEKFRQLFLPKFIKKNKVGIKKEESDTPSSPPQKSTKIDSAVPSTSSRDDVISLSDDTSDEYISTVTKQPVVSPITPSRTTKLISITPTTSDVAKATLIVCPLSVLSNWTDQICTHVNRAVSLRVYLYYGLQRIKDIEYLKKQDIILTTYPTMANDYSKCVNKDTKEVNLAYSPLHQIKWLRIILDEGHFIRNKRTSLARSVLALEGERRWVITGTPIQNRIEDLWVILLFLQLKPFIDKKWWNKMIANVLKKRGQASRDLADFRLNTLIKHISIRRLKDEKVENRKLVELPPRQVVIQDIELSAKERELYNMVQEKGQNTIRRYIRDDSILHHYGHCFAILMRLRQMCLHPRLCKTYLTELKEALDQIQNVDDDDDEDNSEDDNKEKLIKILIEAISAGDSEECAVCLETLNDPVITTCSHIFCSACITDVLNAEGVAPLCPMCRGPVSEADLIRVPEERLTNQNTEEASSGDDDQEEFAGSAKLKALISALEAIRDKDPSIKSVIVSQFTSYLNIVGECLDRNGFPFLRFDGTMNIDERTKVLEDFSENCPETVFLLSMSAGGTGLSLTAASRVFLMDPAWNPAVEEQCFDRCHRMGQTKEVIITKYIVMDTVEERMLTLQKQKRMLMTNAFGAKAQSEEDKRRTRVRDIAHLIGLRPART